MVFPVPCEFKGGYSVKKESFAIPQESLIASQPGESNSLDMSRILLLGDARRGFRKESGSSVW